MGREQWFYLLSSDTRVGGLCAETLRRYLEWFSRKNLDGRPSMKNIVKIKNLGDPEEFGMA